MSLTKKHGVLDGAAYLGGQRGHDGQVGTRKVVYLVRVDVQYAQYLLAGDNGDRHLGADIGEKAVWQPARVTMDVIGNYGRFRACRAGHDRNRRVDVYLDVVDIRYLVVGFRPPPAAGPYRQRLVIFLLHEQMRVIQPKTPLG